MKNPTDNLNAYLVGGAVRDRLLGIEVKDRDWVVVGATPAEMLRRGFKPVGKDFPVFAHPRNGEQYALARRERKIGKGYRGFAAVSAPDITLEQDLRRRDITINAIAEDGDGALIDPFGGAADIKRRVIRHVSAAFSEDPVRILRAARFAARFNHLGFTIHRDTYALMRQMVAAGEADALQPERVWQELRSAFSDGATSRFIAELRKCGALARVMPELDALFGVAQPAEHHPEIDAGEHMLLALDAAHKLSSDPLVIFAAMTHDLGKALTPASALPSHPDHELAGLKPIETLCERLRAPVQYRKFALTVCKNHMLFHRLAELTPSAVLNLLESLNAFNRREQVRMFGLCGLADKRGRKGRADEKAPQFELLQKYHAAALTVDAAAIAAGLSDGEQIKRAVRASRVAAIAAVKAADA